ncbi:MAG: hypothetical protein JST26_02885 [Bacteroidetes bacterium]|nr:hypothetical protein [Bacteroidota bacterium]
MNKSFTTGLLFMGAIVLMSFQGGPNVLCDQKALKEKTKEFLDPYNYDSSELTRLQYKKKESIKEIEVPLFIGEKYRFAFNTEALPKPIEVQIYNKDKESKNRKLLFSSKGLPADQKQFTFEYAKARHVFIDYVVPPSDSSAFSGCVVFMVGYK